LIEIRMDQRLSR